MEEMKEAVIGISGEIEHPHETVDACVIRAAAHVRESQKHPAKGASARARRTQCEHRFQPMGPQHGFSRKLICHSDSIIMLSADEQYSMERRGDFYHGRRPRIDTGATNREDQAGAGGAGGYAPGKPVNTVQRMWKARLPLQGRSAAKARPLLPGQLYAKGKEQQQVCQKGGSARGSKTDREL